MLSDLITNTSAVWGEMGSGSSKSGDEKNNRKFPSTVRLINALQSRHKSSQKRLKEKNVSHTGDNEIVRTSVTYTDTSLAWDCLRQGHVPCCQHLETTSLQLSDFRRQQGHAQCLEELPEEEGEEKDEPVNISYDITTQQKVSDDLCDICGVYTASMTFPCRVCTRVYHTSCLRTMGRCQDQQSLVHLERAHTNIGWSCFHCDNLSSLLTHAEMLSVMEAFDKCDADQSSSITQEEYLCYQRKLYLDRMGYEMSPEEEEDEVFRFKHMAAHDTHCPHVTWWVFLNYHVIGVLQKRSKNRIVRLLTAKEVQRARETFRCLDRDGNGQISEVEAKAALDIWYKKFYGNNSYLQNKAKEENSPLAIHVEENVKILMNADPERNGMVSWKEYLEEQAVYILSARSNAQTLPIDAILAQRSRKH